MPTDGDSHRYLLTDLYKKIPKKPSRGVNSLFGTSGVFSDTENQLARAANGTSSLNQPVRWHDGPSASPLGSGSVFMLGGVAQGMPPKSGLFAVAAADVMRPHGWK